MILEDEPGRKLPEAPHLHVTRYYISQLQYITISSLQIVDSGLKCHTLSHIIMPSQRLPSARRVILLQTNGLNCPRSDSKRTPSPKLRTTPLNEQLNLGFVLLCDVVILSMCHARC
jgi:hypothetical protein